MIYGKVAEAFCNWTGGWMDVSAGLNATVIFLRIIIFTCSLHIMSEIMSTFAEHKTKFLAIKVKSMELKISLYINYARNHPVLV